MSNDDRPPMDKKRYTWAVKYRWPLLLAMATLPLLEAINSFLDVQVVDTDMPADDGGYMHVVSQTISLNEVGIADRIVSALPALVMTMGLLGIAVFAARRIGREADGTIEHGEKDMNVPLYCWSLSITIVVAQLTNFLVTFYFRSSTGMHVSAKPLDFLSVIQVCVVLLAGLAAGAIQAGIKARKDYEKAAAELDTVI